METATSARYHSFKITDISHGDLLDQRNTDKVYSKGLFFRATLRNEHTTPRMLRIMAITLRGSTASADTATWADILISSAFTKTAPSGYTNDILYRVNRDEYLVLFDRVFTIGVANDGGTTKMINFWAPTRKLVSFLYNSDENRKNPIYILMLLTECEGQLTSSNHLSIGYSASHYYTDVESVKRYGHRPTVRAVAYGPTHRR